MPGDIQPINSQAGNNITPQAPNAPPGLPAPGTSPSNNGLWLSQVIALDRVASIDPSRAPVASLSLDELDLMAQAGLDPGRPVATGATPGVRPQATPEFSTSDFGVMMTGRLNIRAVQDGSTLTTPSTVVNFQAIDATTGQPLTSSFRQVQGVLPEAPTGVYETASSLGGSGHDLQHLVNFHPVTLQPLDLSQAIRPNDPYILPPTDGVFTSNGLIRELMNEAFQRSLSRFPTPENAQPANTPTISNLRIAGNHQTLDVANNVFLRSDPAFINDVYDLIPSEGAPSIGFASVSPNGDRAAFLTNRTLDASMEDAYTQLFETNPDLVRYFQSNYATALETTDRAASIVDPEQAPDQTPRGGNGNLGNLTFTLPPDSTLRLLEAQRDGLTPFAATPAVQNELDIIDWIIDQGRGRATGRSPSTPADPSGPTLPNDADDSGDDPDGGGNGPGSGRRWFTPGPNGEPSLMRQILTPQAVFPLSGQSSVGLGETPLRAGVLTAPVVPVQIGADGATTFGAGTRLFISESVSGQLGPARVSLGLAEITDNPANLPQNPGPTIAGPTATATFEVFPGVRLGGFTNVMSPPTPPAADGTAYSQRLSVNFGPMATVALPTEAIGLPPINYVTGASWGIHFDTAPGTDRIGAITINNRVRFPAEGFVQGPPVGAMINGLNTVTSVVNNVIRSATAFGEQSVASYQDLTTRLAPGTTFGVADTPIFLSPADIGAMHSALAPNAAARIIDRAPFGATTTADVVRAFSNTPEPITRNIAPPDVTTDTGLSGLRRSRRPEPMVETDEALRLEFEDADIEDLQLTTSEIIGNLAQTGDRFVNRNLRFAEDLGVRFNVSADPENMGLYTPETRTVDFAADLVNAARIDPQSAMVLRGVAAEELQHVWHAHRGRNGVGFLNPQVTDERFRPTAPENYETARDIFVSTYVERGLTDEVLSFHQNIIHGPEPALLDGGAARMAEVFGDTPYGRLSREQLENARSIMANDPDFEYRELLTNDAINLFNAAYGDLRNVEFGFSERPLPSLDNNEPGVRAPGAPQRQSSANDDAIQRTFLRTLSENPAILDPNGFDTPQAAGLNAANFLADFNARQIPVGGGAEATVPIFISPTESGARFFTGQPLIGADYEVPSATDLAAAQRTPNGSTFVTGLAHNHPFTADVARIPGPSLSDAIVLLERSGGVLPTLDTIQVVQTIEHEGGISPISMRLQPKPARYFVDDSFKVSRMIERGSADLNDYVTLTYQPLDGVAFSTTPSINVVGLDDAGEPVVYLRPESVIGTQADMSAPLIQANPQTRQTAPSTLDWSTIGDRANFPAIDIATRLIGPTLQTPGVNVTRPLSAPLQPGMPYNAVPRPENYADQGQYRADASTWVNAMRQRFDRTLTSRNDIDVLVEGPDGDMVSFRDLSDRLRAEAPAFVRSMFSNNMAASQVQYQLSNNADLAEAIRLSNEALESGAPQAAIQQMLDNGEIVFGDTTSGGRPPANTISQAGVAEVRDLVRAMPNGDAPFQAFGFAYVPSIAGPFNDLSNAAAFDITSRLSDGAITTNDQFWSALRDYRTEVARNVTVPATPVEDVGFRNPTVERETPYAGRFLSFRQPALTLLTTQPAIDMTTGASVTPEEARARLDDFVAGGAPANLSTTLTIRPDNLANAVANGRSDLLVDTQGRALSFSPELTYSVTTETTNYEGLPTATHVIPRFGDPGAQALWRDTESLFDAIMAAEPGDPAVLDLTGQWLYRTANLMPNERGTAAMSHVGAAALLGSNGFALGPLNRSGYDGLMIDPSGNRVLTAFPSALDLNAFTLTEDDFVSGFTSGRFAPIVPIEGGLGGVTTPTPPEVDPASPQSRAPDADNAAASAVRFQLSNNADLADAIQRSNQALESGEPQAGIQRMRDDGEIVNGSSGRFNANWDLIRSVNYDVPENVINVLPRSSNYYEIAPRLQYPDDGIVYVAEQQQIFNLNGPDEWSIVFDQITTNPNYSTGTPVYCVWCESGRRGAVNGASHAAHISDVLGTPTQGYLGYFQISETGLRIPPIRNFGDYEIRPLELPLRQP